MWCWPWCDVDVIVTDCCSIVVRIHKAALKEVEWLGCGFIFRPSSWRDVYVELGHTTNRSSRCSNTATTLLWSSRCSNTATTLLWSSERHGALASLNMEALDLDGPCIWNPQPNHSTSHEWELPCGFIFRPSSWRDVYVELGHTTNRSSERHGALDASQTSHKQELWKTWSSCISVLYVDVDVMLTLMWCWCDCDWLLQHCC